MHPEDGRVVSNFIVQALRGQALTLYGEGGQTRSFCFVDDMVEGLLRLMASPEEFTGPVNLGNPVETSVRELAERIRKLTGSTSPLEFLPLPPDDPGQRKPDISLARRELSWEPKVGLDEGLERTISYFRALLV